VVGLAFVWNTIRDQDMVTIGTTTPDEAREVIELSLDLLKPPACRRINYKRHAARNLYINARKINTKDHTETQRFTKKTKV